MCVTRNARVGNVGVAGEDICSHTNFKYTFQIYYYFMGMSVPCTHVHLCIACMPGAQGGCELPHECWEWSPGPP